MSALEEMIQREETDADDVQLAPDEIEAMSEATADDETDQADEREPASDALMEQIGKQLDKEGDRHAKAVARIMGDSMGDLVTCPLCITPGYVTVVPPPDFDPYQRQAVLAAMGDDADPELRPHPNRRRCSTCDGWGDLTTGSRKNTTAVDGCPTCMGNGWIDSAAEQAMRDAQPLPAPLGAPGVTSPSQVTQGGYTFALSPGGSSDPAGRLAGHPLWGLPAETGGV